MAQTDAQPGYVILRNKDTLDTTKLAFEQRKGAKDVIKIKYLVGERRETIYLQSAACTLRSPLIYDGELQKAVDVDLWESLHPRNKEFVHKITGIEGACSEYLKSAEKDGADETANRLLKPSLRVLQKAKRHHLPTLHLFTDDQTTIYRTDSKEEASDQVSDVDHDSKVQIIVELVGLRVTKRNGAGQLLWRLAQLKVLNEKHPEVSAPNGRLPKGVDFFAEDESREVQNTPETIEA